MAQAEICARDLMQQVLVIQLPRGDRGEADLAAYRDYVVESLAQGVLILGSGTTWAVEALPSLGGVQIQRDPGILRAHSVPEPKPEPQPPRPNPWREKKETLERRAVWAVWRWWPAGAAEISRRTSCGASSPEPRNYPLSSGGSSAGPWTSWRRVRMSKILRKIQSGRLVYAVVYTAPTAGDSPRQRAQKRQASTAAREKLNARTSFQKLERTLAANFDDGDLFLTLTYDDKHLPDGREAARRIRSFLSRLRKARKERGQLLHYIYVTEGCNPGGRLHHHVVLNATGDDLEEIRRLWIYGDNLELRRLTFHRDHTYEDLASYLTKEPREWGHPQVGERTWTPSLGLAHPEPETETVPCPPRRRRTSYLGRVLWSTDMGSLRGSSISCPGIRPGNGGATDGNGKKNSFSILFSLGGKYILFKF